jgi:hypothetical protein
MARPTHGDLAADAAAFLTKSKCTIEGISGNPQEIERQATLLVKWARKRNVLLSASHTAGLEQHSFPTAEHEVFYRKSDNRAVKRTYAGTFGVVNEPKGKQHHATPLFYLRRLQLMNQIFDSDLRLEGVAFGKSLIIGSQGEKPCLVISQPWFEAADENNPFPTEDTVAEFMVSLGFVPVKGSFFAWHNDKNGITAYDARPDNFINSFHGVVPIDLVVAEDSED